MSTIEHIVLNTHRCIACNGGQMIYTEALINNQLMVTTLTCRTCDGTVVPDPCGNFALEGAHTWTCPLWQAPSKPLIDFDKPFDEERDEWMR
jgi:hypothetical protein